ncbi:MAG: hypothetical protein WAP35_03825 [Solirubrobacterales bacterium]
MSDALELEDIQGIVARGYGKLRFASLLLIRFDDRRAAGRWLVELATQVNNAAGETPKRSAVNFAVTAEGLRELRLPKKLIDQFSFEFRDGMTAEHRQRVLGDTDGRSPANWEWGGAKSPRIDAVLMLYAASKNRLAALEAEYDKGTNARGITVVRTLETAPLTDREHFGFRDGISQPVIRGLQKERDGAIATGEFVLGYTNEYGLYTDRPTLAADQPGADELPADPQNRKRSDLGRNGSYLVMRQLGQDVPGFWQYLDAATRSNGSGSDATERDRLAARIVGRWRSGAPLVLSTLEDDEELGASRDGAANDFNYAEMDPDGLSCPIGAHIRRSNPRDSLDPDPGSEGSLAINRRHRLLRRGRAYGPPITINQALSANGSTADGASDPRGLHFICLCTNLSRQFEFVQHTWINNEKFANLYDDPDPLIGPPGRTLTIQAKPVRKRVKQMPEFVSVQGGAYFFLPGLRALRFIGRSAQR